MQTNHTPGPWTAKVIDTVNDAPTYWHITDNCLGVVGDVQSVNPFDARLIAAAPDLLAALQNVVACFDANDPDSMANAIADARAAIAKATGGAV